MYLSFGIAPSGPIAPMFRFEICLRERKKLHHMIPALNWIIHAISFLFFSSLAVSVHFLALREGC